MKKIILFFIVTIGLLFGYSYLKAYEDVFANKAYLPVILMSDNNPIGDVFVIGTPTVITTSSYMFIYAEIYNGTDRNISSYYLPVNTFDIDGYILDRGNAYKHISILPSHEKTCIVALLDLNENYSYYEFEEKQVYYTDDLPLNVYPFNFTGGYNNSISDWFKVIGQIRNGTEFNVVASSVVATVYDYNGHVIDCTTGYATTSHLSPNQETSFVLYGDNYGDYVNYRLQVDSYIYP